MHRTCFSIPFSQIIFNRAFQYTVFTEPVMHQLETVSTNDQPWVYNTSMIGTDFTLTSTDDKSKKRKGKGKRYSNLMPWSK